MLLFTNAHQMDTNGQKVSIYERGLAWLQIHMLAKVE